MSQRHTRSAAPTYRVFAQVAVAALLSVCVLATGLATLAGFSADIGVKENRSLAQPGPPSLANLLSRDYFQKLNAWANDRQALREPLIALFSATKLYGFGAPLNDKTLVGQDGFYFYGMQSMRRDFQRRNRFEANPAYVREVLSYLRGLEAWGQQTGRRVMFMVAPNKHNVYPDRYDPAYRRGDGPGTADLVESWLERTIPAMAVPIGEPLRLDARERLVYFRTDTHWNDWGAKLAVDVVVERLAAAPGKLPVASLPEGVQEVPEVLEHGNFARLLGLPLAETVTRPVPAIGFQAVEDEDLRRQLRESHLPGRPRLFTVLRNPKAPEAPKLLVLGDSFMKRMVPYLAERFSLSVFYNPFGSPNAPAQRFPQDLINAVDPDVVLVQYVERRVRPCRATKNRAEKCANTLIGSMARNLQAMRLEKLSQKGTTMASAVAPRVAGMDWVLDLPEPLPEGRKLLLRVRYQGAGAGKLRILSKRIPTQWRGEEFAVELDARRREGLVIAAPTRKGTAVILTPSGSLTPNDVTFDVISAPDDTDPATIIAPAATGRRLSSHIN